MHTYTYELLHTQDDEESFAFEAEKILLNAIATKPDDSLFKKEYAKVMEMQGNVGGAEEMLRQVCMYVFMYVCMYVCIHVWLCWWGGGDAQTGHVCMYTYIHTNWISAKREIYTLKYPNV